MTSSPPTQLATRCRERAETGLRVAARIVALWLLLQAGEWIAARLRLPIPGNVVGMVLLFVLLMLGLVKESWLQAGAGLLTRHLAFFFIPIAVGLMQWTALFVEAGHWLLLALGMSAAATLVVTGGIVQRLGRRHQEAPRWNVSPSSSSPLLSLSPRTPTAAGHS